MTPVKAIFPLLTILPLIAALAACGNNRSDPFSKCGNGICDGGEQCDDGAVTGGNADEDQCLSTCQYNSCGDGFVNHGPSGTGQRCVLPVPDDVLPAEECDPGSLEPISCASLGFTGGQAGCTLDCQFDTSTCGPPFTQPPTNTSTPTPTSTPTITPTNTPGGPTNTPTATPTPTPTPTLPRPEGCGDGVVVPPETCDDGNDIDFDECPNNCVINPCEPTDTKLPFAVIFEPPLLQTAVSATFFVKYPDGVVGIPGSGFSPDVRGSLFFGTCDGGGEEFCETTANCPKGDRCVRPSVSVIANDFDHGIRVVLTVTAGLGAGPAFVVDFDECSGATFPSAAEFSCTIEGCADEFGTIDCTCSIEER